MTDSTSIHDKLVAIQSGLKTPKSQKNTHMNYSYRSCEDILEAVKPLLKEHNLVLTVWDKMVEVGGRIYVEATVSLTNGEGDKAETKAYAREAESKKGMDEAQITGAASSYARKYALNGLFCIDDTKDADTMDNTKEPKKAPIKATTEQRMKINSLCVSLAKDEAACKKNYCGEGDWTHESVLKALADLQSASDKLGKEIDSE